MVTLVGRPLGLRVTVARGHDWARTAAAAAAAQWWFTAVPADPVAALRHVTARERELQGRAARARQAAWQQFGALDPRHRAERLVLAELEQLVADRAKCWDPRLDELVALALAWREAWQVQAPALPAAVEAPAVAPPRPLPEQVEVVWTTALPAAAAAERDAAGAVLGPLDERRVALPVALARLAEVTAEVATFADGAARRTREPRQAARYSALATRLLALHRAARFLLGA